MSRTSVIQVSGGIGNQLFMLTAAAAFLDSQPAKRVNIDLSTVGTDRSPHLSSVSSLRMDSFVGKDLSRIKFVRSSAARRFAERALFPKAIVRLREVGYVDFSSLNLTRKARLIGYFQSERYLNIARQREWPLLIEPINPSADFANAMEVSESDGYAFIHMRRGDYLQHKETLGILSLDYFIKGVIQLANLGYEKFCIISDDAEWAERAIEFFPPGVYRILSRDFQLTDEETLSIASQAPAILISNSSFGYWAALAGREKTILGPKTWFRGIPCPDQLFGTSRVVLVESTWED